MTKIHGAFFIGIGAAVAIVSILIDIKLESQSMTLFAIAGTVMIIFGAIKMKLDKQEKPAQRPQYPYQHNTQYRQHQQYQRYPQQPQYRQPPRR